jgi:carboxyl-terminal processing protease
MRRITGPLLLLPLILFLFRPSPAQHPNDATKALREKTFAMVWQTVDDTFFDPTFNGVNWSEIKRIYAAKVAAAQTDEQFHQILSDMLRELKESHFAIIPPSAYLPEEEQGRGSREADAGMTIQIVEGRPTIVREDAGGAAANAGLKPGFIVLQIGDEKLDEIRQRLASRDDRQIMKDFLLSAVAHSLLSGRVGESVNVMALDGAGAAKTYALRLTKSKGKPIKLMELPTMYGFVESKRLPQGIGLIRFNVFFMDLLDEVESDIAAMHGERALILDLRGNPGGFGAMAVPITRHLVGKPTSLGTMRLRTGSLNLVAVNPDAHPFRGPVVILTDEGTGSTSEILAAGLQECGRAIVVGGRTLGAVLPSVFVKLPDGSRLQYAIADFRTPKGVLLEGRGVVPDVPVHLSRQALLAGKDLALDKAIDTLLSGENRKRAVSHEQK